MNTIDYTQVPYSFALCLHTQCPMASTCLRRLVWDAVPDRQEQFNVLNPSCTTSSDTCRHYRPVQKEVYARGFCGMQAQMLPAQYAKFSDKLIKYFSRNCYYERRRGDRLCSPKEIVYIREVLTSIGLPHLEFDAYEERYNFAD
jgi:hypothetical protein